MIEEIVIVHYLPNIDRKEYLDKSNIFNIYNCRYDTSFQDPECLLPDMVFENITAKEMCVFQAHKSILLDLCKRKVKNFIVIEDDALINDVPDICMFFETVMAQFHKSDADIIFIAEAPKEWNMSVQHPVPNKLVYTDVLQKSIATHCYSIKYDILEKFIAQLTPTTPIDHDFNRVIDTLKLKVAWTYPGIKQGSHVDVYKSNLR